MDYRLIVPVDADAEYGITYIVTRIDSLGYKWVYRYCSGLTWADVARVVLARDSVTILAVA